MYTMYRFRNYLILAKHLKTADQNVNENVAINLNFDIMWYTKYHTSLKLDPQSQVTNYNTTQTTKYIIIALNIHIMAVKLHIKEYMIMWTSLYIRLTI